MLDRCVFKKFFATKKEPCRKDNEKKRIKMEDISPESDLFICLKMTSRVLISKSDNAILDSWTVLP